MFLKVNTPEFRQFCSHRTVSCGNRRSVVEMGELKTKFRAKTGLWKGVPKGGGDRMGMEDPKVKLI